VITDLVAVGVLAYFNEKKHQSSGANRGDWFYYWFVSEIITPKLSTVEQPSYEMGVEVISLLLEEMQCNKENKIFEPKIVELGTSVIVRNQVLKIKG
jgi:LacI family transcriptional regulator